MNKQKNYRRCISCRQLAPKNILFRIVKNHSDGQITVDSGMGRSAYICKNEECLTIAWKQKKLSKALKINISPATYIELKQKKWE